MTDRDTGAGAGRDIRITESPAVPWLGILFGYAPMLPLLAGAGAAWWLGGEAGRAVSDLTALWGCAVLLFLSGVRRGISFRTEGGATLGQIATMLGLFGLGVLALAALFRGQPAAALLLLVGGYAVILVLDPVAARRGEAPLFFARLRPAQMPLAIGSLLALLALRWS